MIAKHVRNCAEKWDLHPPAASPCCMRTPACTLNPSTSALHGLRLR